MRIAHNKLNLMNKRFGRLVALEDVGRTKKQGVLWRCKCDCGNETKVAAENLKSGNTQSCGCLNRERLLLNHYRLPPGEVAFNEVYRTYQGRAKWTYDVSFELSKKEFRALTQLDCFYCGAKPATGYTRVGAEKGAYVYNGLDRIDSTKGYTSNNVVPCCIRCNMWKSNMDIGEFLNCVIRIAERHSLTAGTGIDSDSLSVPKPLN